MESGKSLELDEKSLDFNEKSSDLDEKSLRFHEKSVQIMFCFDHVFEPFPIVLCIFKHAIFMHFWSDVAISRKLTPYPAPPLALHP